MRVRLGLAGAVALALGHYAALCRQVPLVDDYWIFLRYADNALGGHGITFNPDGERVEGYTSALQLLLVIVLRAVGLGVTCGRWLNGFLFAAVAVLGFRATRSAGITSAGAVFAAFALATNHMLALHAAYGMESPLCCCAVLLALEFYFRDRSIASGLCWAAAVLARPEVILLFIMAIAMSRAKERLAAAGCAILVPHLVWRRLYYGYWLPNSYYAKTGGPFFSRLHEGLVGAHRLALTFSGALIAASVLLWLLSADRRRGAAAAIAVCLSIASLLFEGVDDWFRWWHSSVLALGAVLLLSWTVAVRSRMVFGIGGAVVALAFAGELDVDARSVVHDFVPTAEAFRRVAKGGTLATGASGAIPYLSGLVTYDTLGINDVHIAHAPLETLEHGGFAHHRGDGAYILAKRPTYLIANYELTREPEPGPGYEKTFIEMAKLPDFARLYDFRSVRTDGRYLNYYQLRDNAETP